MSSTNGRAESSIGRSSHQETMDEAYEQRLQKASDRTARAEGKISRMEETLTKKDERSNPGLTLLQTPKSEEIRRANLAALKAAKERDLAARNEEATRKENHERALAALQTNGSGRPTHLPNERQKAPSKDNPSIPLKYVFRNRLPRRTYPRRVSHNAPLVPTEIMHQQPRPEPQHERAEIAIDVMGRCISDSRSFRSEVVAEPASNAHDKSTSNKQIAGRMTWLDNLFRKFLKFLVCVCYVALGWILLALAYQMCSETVTFTTRPTNVVHEVSQHVDSIHNLTNAFGKRIQQELLLAHAAYCHVLEAACQTDPKPRALPFFDSAEAAWVTSNTARHCVRPPQCFVDVPFPQFEDDNYQRREKLGKLLSDLALELGNGISEADTLLTGLLRTTQHLTYGVATVEEAYHDLSRNALRGTHLEVPFQGGLSRLFDPFFPWYERWRASHISMVLSNPFWREFYGLLIFIFRLFDARLILRTAQIESLNDVLSKFWSTQLKHMSELSGVLDPDHLWRRTGRNLSTQAACLQNANAIRKLYVVTNDTIGSNEQKFHKEVAGACRIFESSAHRDFNSARTIVYRAHQLLGESAARNAATSHLGHGGHIIVSRPWAPRLYFGGSWSVVLNVNNLPPSDQAEKPWPAMSIARLADKQAGSLTVLEGLRDITSL